MIDDKELAANRRAVNRAYLFQNGFVILVAILFLVVSLSFWTNPGSVASSIGHVPPYDYYWNGFYFTGSVMVLIGSLGRRVGIEVAGHILLVPGLSLNCLIAFMVLGVHATSLLCLVFALAASFRALGLVMGWRDVHK